MTAPPKESVCERHGCECGQIVDDFLKTLGENDSDRLFHYTSADGLLGILGSRTLRATNLLHMNDPTELTHGVKEFNIYLNNKFPLFSNIQKDFWGEFNSVDLISAARNIAQIYYSISFSFKCNDLNQWRSYAKDGTGFSLEFSRKLIDSHAKNLEESNRGDVFTFPISYGKSIFLEKFGELVETTNHQIKNAKDGETKKCIAKNVFRSVSLLSFYLKNKHYHEESEYRIIIPSPTESKNPAIQYRTRGSSIVPFTEFEWKSATPCPLKRVWIGPAAAHDTTPESVKAFLMHCGYGDEIEVVRSDIPYRSL